MGQRKFVLLCVDDEETPLLLRKMVLQKAGYEVVTANSAKQAMEVLDSVSVDLVLTDLLMPGVTGAELARQIKDNKPELPVVLLSGVNEVPPEASSADLFISKVEGPAFMCEKISDVLNSSEQ